jgi:hypothetical protein
VISYTLGFPEKMSSNAFSIAFNMSVKLVYPKCKGHSRAHLYIVVDIQLH